MALGHVAPQATWASTIVAFGSVVAHTAVLLVFQLGQPRIFFSIARDGLLPPVFAKVHPRFKTPHITTVVTGLLVGGFAGVASIDEMVDLTNIGTLFAFVLVCIGIPILRRRDPDRARPFKVPFGPWALPGMGAASCLFLMIYLPPASWWRFVAWLLLGLAVYTSYGYFHSTLGRRAGRPERAPRAAHLVSAGLALLGVGLFMLPHEAGWAEVLRRAGDAQVDGHGRALWALGLTIGGALGAAAGGSWWRRGPRAVASGAA